MARNYQASNKKYRNSEKGKARLKIWLASPKGQHYTERALQKARERRAKQKLGLLEMPPQHRNFPVKILMYLTVEQNEILDKYSNQSAVPKTHVIRHLIEGLKDELASVSMIEEAEACRTAKIDTAPPEEPLKIPKPAKEPLKIPKPAKKDPNWESTVRRSQLSRQIRADEFAAIKDKKNKLIDSIFESSEKCLTLDEIFQEVQKVSDYPMLDIKCVLLHKRFIKIVSRGSTVYKIDPDYSPDDPFYDD